MTVLLTGAGGFLGQHVANSLLASGVAALRLHYRSAPLAGQVEVLQAAFPHARLETVAGNLQARGSLGPLVDGVDLVVHAAAGMRGAAADLYANTVIGTRNLLEAAVTARVRRVLLVSSFSVYRTQPLASGAVLDESCAIEPDGVDRGAYGYAKTAQEHLARAWQAQHGLELVVVRPGVIYGPGGGEFSARVGIQAMGLFFSLGGGAILPLTYVENCADAVARAALDGAAGAAFNVVDDDLPSCAQYLREYRRAVRPVRAVAVPYPLLLWGSRQLERYHRRSKGQLPAVFTPRIVESMYRPLRYSNAALKGIGWTPRISTPEGLAATFAAFRDRRR